MPYQNWYSAATNAAVDMNMPPALVPPTPSVMTPPRQPITPINANVPTGIDSNEREFQDTSNYSMGNLRTAGRFDRETAMITPEETQRMMYGDQAFRNTRRITEERINHPKLASNIRMPSTRSQEDMAREASGGGTEFIDINASNPFSDQYSNLFS
tara:strand:- start:3341 stop:3808 length:468 start_codon:yes stop_codon:yes gene_type:complete